MSEPFDQRWWRARMADRLQDWRSRMQQYGVPSVYAFLSAAALWPVAEATRGGEWAALGALGAVAAGVGSNLLANRIQTWEDEADGARQLAAYGCPYEPNDGRENLKAGRDVTRVLRGGTFGSALRVVRCAKRYKHHPSMRGSLIGFRVVVRPCC